jgi:hypothetical protein
MIYPTTWPGPTDYSCIFRKASSVDEYFVSLVYEDTKDSDNVVFRPLAYNNASFIVISPSATISLHKTLSYDFGLAGQSWSLTFDITDVNGHYPTYAGTSLQVRLSNGTYLPTSMIDDNTFTCSSFNEPVAKIVSLTAAVRYDVGTVHYADISAPTTVQFILRGVATFAKSPGNTNGALVGTTFTTSVSLASTNISSFTSFANNRIINVLDGNNNFTSYLSEGKASYVNISTTIVLTSPSVVQLSVYLLPPTDVNLPPVLVSANTLPIVGVEHVLLDGFALPSPVRPSGTGTTDFTLNLKLKDGGSGSIDSYYNYGNSVTYGCAYKDEAFVSGVFNKTTNSIKCSMPMKVATPAELNAHIRTSTNTSIVWSSNSSYILFYDKVNILYTWPYVVVHETEGPFNTTVQLTTQTEIPSCDNLYALYTNGNATRYSRAICAPRFVRSSPINVVSVTIYVDYVNTTSNTTNVPLTLVYIINGYEISPFSNNTVYVNYIKGPIDFLNASSVFQPQTINKYYPLSFESPKDTTFTVFIGSSDGITRPIPCTSARIPTCNVTLDGIPIQFIPDKIYLTINFRRGSVAPIVVTMLTHFYKKPVNVLKNYPYFADTVSSGSGTMVSFLTDQSFNTGIQYYCQRVSNVVSTRILTLATVYNQVVTCNISSVGVDDTATINVLYGYLFDATKIGYRLPVDDISNYTIASGTSGTIEFNSLTFSPSLMTKTEVGRNFTLVYNNTWSPYIVPVAYRSQATKVSIVGSSLSYDATILATGVLQFTKANQISTSNNAIRYSIQFTPYQISMNVSMPQQVTITAPMFSKTLIYSPYQISTKFPMSIKRGTNSTIGYKFIASAGSSGYISLSESYTLYAQSPFNITTKHPCTPDTQDVTLLNCAIMYNATELVNNNYISLLPYLSIPSANNSIVALATDNVSSNILKLFYIDTGPMQLAPASQQMLVYTVRPNTLRVRINSTSMPSSDLLSKYIWFEYKFASGHTQYVQATYVSSTSVSEITSYLFNCTTTFTLGTVGRVNITLWYRESDSSYYVMGTAFQISTNYIEAIYTDQINILESSLTATRVNTTVAVSLKTSFRATADYGTAEVAIVYQAPVTNATGVYANSTFEYRPI